MAHRTGITAKREKQILLQQSKIYISYGSADDHDQAGDIAILKSVQPKEDRVLSVFNDSIAYDGDNREALFIKVIREVLLVYPMVIKPRPSFSTGNIS